jgi:hypothetical protein
MKRTMIAALLLTVSITHALVYCMDEKEFANFDKDFSHLEQTIKDVYRDYKPFLWDEILRRSIKESDLYAVRDGLEYAAKQNMSLSLLLLEKVAHDTAAERNLKRKEIKNTLRTNGFPHQEDCDGCDCYCIQRLDSYEAVRTPCYDARKIMETISHAKNGTLIEFLKQDRERFH